MPDARAAHSLGIPRTAVMSKVKRLGLLVTACRTGMTSARAARALRIPRTTLMSKAGQSGLS